MSGTAGWTFLFLVASALVGSFFVLAIEFTGVFGSLSRGFVGGSGS